MKNLVLLLVAALTTSMTQAEEYYVSGEVDYTRIKLADGRFNPKMTKIKFGVLASETTFLKGVGLEFVAGQSQGEDTVNGFGVDIGQHWGVYTSFATEDIGEFRLAMNIGYTSTEINTVSSNLNSEFSQVLEGFSYGLTFQQRFESFPSFRWILDCTQMYSDDNVDMAGCGFGVKYDF